MKNMCFKTFETAVERNKKKTIKTLPKRRKKIAIFLENYGKSMVIESVYTVYAVHLVRSDGTALSNKSRIIVIVEMKTNRIEIESSKKSAIH